VKGSQVCILGGTGFVGRQLAWRLIKAGYQCRIPTRYSHRHRDLLLIPGVSLVHVKKLDSATLQQCFLDCQFVINCIGLYRETKTYSFHATHVELVQQIIAAIKNTKVSRYFHLSVLNSEQIQNQHPWLQSKYEGEQCALQADCAVTNFRLAVMFGQADHFVNALAKLIKTAPGFVANMPISIRLAPIWVGDVAEALVRSLDDPSSIQRTYDLFGSRCFTWHELTTHINNYLQNKQDDPDSLTPKRRLWHHHWITTQLAASIPVWPLLATTVDHLCTSHNGLLEFGIHATDLDVELPHFLSFVQN
jgi:NADH dehydrogenase